MAIQGIEQPAVIQIGESLRLRKFDGVFDFALEWYQDVDTVWLVDGDRVPYTPELLSRMYNWLNESGELYFIEVLEDGAYIPIGDVTFWQGDMPIVIGDPRYRGKGIGTKVVAALIERGRTLGYDHLEVEEIYDWNEASRRCFERLGFRACKKTDKGHSYHFDIPSTEQEEP